MLANVRQQIDKIIADINKVAPVEKIYLFGSYAYGKPTEDSDIDLCVIVKENPIRKRDLMKLIRKSIVNVADVPIDILVYFKDEFDARSKLNSTIEYKIVREGECIYEQ
ncbi:nucleotidyltransferase domain-containing protein [Caldicoprobacter faecalis]|uniref:Nucleotidyltransferase domain-containing protein n=1 Tax=Caldicoprobacter faecalis TaxID=937334 RepID=A0A1I5W6I4_9FIRM|nr:nucleotidyltransferase domain-containing protein [Caldicoprobacter faecalis]PZN09304.1 MAG: nucleotidyltransferase domain-containing protein [Caldicoprobacter oshimai]SFQ15340.1 Nucleotidyltransferase domain-containing protein [Caldicoprobacter faecalis]